MVGGEDLQTFYSDANNDLFTESGKLNEISIQPALCRCKDFIYCMRDLRPGKEFFERNSITRFSGIWEKVPINYSSNKIGRFFNSLYGVAPSNEPGDIILLGGRKVVKKTFTFNSINSTISENDGKDEEVELQDKMFYKVSNSYRAAIPKFFNKDQKVALANLKTKKLEFCNFDENKKNTILGSEILDDKLETVGTLTINAKFNKRLDRFTHAEKNVASKQEERKNDNEVAGANYPRLSIPSVRNTTGKNKYEYFN